MQLKYDGKDGVVTQFGKFEPGWAGAQPDAVGKLLLTIHGFIEIKETSKKSTTKTEG